MAWSRDFKVTEKGLKGKKKTPTLVLGSGDGEKLVLKFDVVSQLDQFELDAEFTVKIGKGAQTKLDRS